MRQPNLLFLMSDQQRADTLAPGSPCQTPYLDALAARGTAFNRCYAPNPICSPTRASLMTGLLPHSHGMVDCTHTVEPYRAELKSGLPFWSQALQAGGYHTGYFGKWHIERSNRLENYGFAEYELNHSPGYAAHRRALGLDELARHFVSRRAVTQPGYRDFTICGVVDEPVEATAEHYSIRAASSSSSARRANRTNPGRSLSARSRRTTPISCRRNTVRATTRPTCPARPVSTIR